MHSTLIGVGRSGQRSSRVEEVAVGFIVIMVVGFLTPAGPFISVFCGCVAAGAMWQIKSRVALAKAAKKSAQARDEASAEADRRIDEARASGTFDRFEKT